MKKIYIKYKILVNGLSIDGNYSIDGFVLKTGHLEKDYFKRKKNTTKDGMDININLYMFSCLTDYEEMTYSYFESENFLEFNVPNKTKIDKNDVNSLLNSNNDILDKIADLEKKLRLIFNIPLLFQIIRIEVYDANKKYLFSTQGNKQISLWNRLTYKLDSDEFYNNSRFNMDLNKMKNTGNRHFDRAIEFYNDSFESDKITNRYILIFSSLEAIFNLDTEEITEKLARFSAKLLSENNNELYDKIYKDIKKLYKKRSAYIHGSKTKNIVSADEKLLRAYTRKIIIAYWMIILKTKKTAKQILEYLDSDEQLDIQVRMMISNLNSPDFSSQQHNLIKLLEKEYGEHITNEIKEYLLSECEKK